MPDIFFIGMLVGGMFVIIGVAVGVFIADKRGWM